MKSFKKNVQLFWTEFAKQEKEIRSQIDDFKNIDRVKFVDTINEIVSIAFTDQPFELGHNDNKNKYELIFTPYGNEVILMQLIYLVETMPDSLKDLWSVYSSSPSFTNHQELSLNLKGQEITVNAEDFKITTHLNEEVKKINIDVSIPIINELPKDEQYKILFMMLDRSISEIYTMKYIGNVNIVEPSKSNWLKKIIAKPSDSKDNIPLTKLKSYIDYLINDNDWNKPNYPFESWSAYKLTPSENEASLRKDIYVGTTSCYHLIEEVLSGEKDVYPINQLSEDGVSLMYVYFCIDNIDREEVLPSRDAVEKKIEEELISNKVAALIGTATGTHHTYLEYIVYDTDTFMESVINIFKEFDFPAKGLNYIY